MGTVGESFYCTVAFQKNKKPVLYIETREKNNIALRVFIKPNELWCSMCCAVGLCLYVYSVYLTINSNEKMSIFV